MLARSARTRTLSVLGSLAIAAALAAPAALPANAAPLTSTTATAAAHKPTIVAQPKSVTAYSTKSATFTVKASAATAYKWQILKAKTWTTISKATTALNGASYRVVVSNKLGTVTSTVAKLTVKLWPGSGTETDPWVINHTFTSGDWKLSIGKADLDAWPEIKAANLGASAPAKGYSYVMAKLTLTKTGKSAQDPYEGADGILVSDTSDGIDDCAGTGQIPNDLYASTAKMKPGQVRSGNTCISIETKALKGSLWDLGGMFDNGKFGDDNFVKLS